MFRISFPRSHMQPETICHVRIGVKLHEFKMPTHSFHAFRRRETHQSPKLGIPEPFFRRQIVGIVRGGGMLMLNTSKCFRHHFGGFFPCAMDV